MIFAFVNHMRPLKVIACVCLSVTNFAMPINNLFVLMG